MSDRYTEDRYRGETPNDGAENEIELNVLWRGIRRRLPVILAATVLVGAATYFWSRGQLPVYEAASSVITVLPPAGVVGATLVPAFPFADRCAG